MRASLPIPQRVENWAWLDALVGPLDEDFVQALNEEPANQQRPALEIFHRADFRSLANRLTKSNPA